MNGWRKKWQLDRVQQAVEKARLDDEARKDCFWPCVHLASSLAGSDARLIYHIAKTRIRITVENATIGIWLSAERFYYTRIRGWSNAEYEAYLDKEFQQTMDFIRKGKA